MPENKKNTVVVGVSAIDVDDHSDHGGHDDHSDHGGHDDHAEHSAKVDDHSDHGGHDDHAECAFELAGKFQLSKGSYKWSFEKVDGEYADPAMKMVILKSNDIEGSEDLAKELLGSKDSINKKCTPRKHQGELCKLKTKQGIIDSNGKIIKWLSGYAEQTNLSNSSCDWVTMASSFHWADFDLATKEFYRILRII